MALSTSALITLDDARDYLGRLPGDTDADEQLEALIEAASRGIMLYTERQFAPAVEDETRVFAYDGSGYLSLANNDVRNVSAVTVGIDSPTTLSVSDYRLRPLPSRHGVYSYIQFVPSRSWCAYPDGLETEAAVTGDWGFASVPLDVQMACKMQVTVWHRKDQMAFTRSYDIETGISTGGEGLAGSVKAFLYQCGYCRTVVA